MLSYGLVGLVCIIGFFSFKMFHGKQQQPPEHPVVSDKPEPTKKVIEQRVSPVVSATSPSKSSSPQAAITPPSEPKIPPAFTVNDTKEDAVKEIESKAVVVSSEKAHVVAVKVEESKDVMVKPGGSKAVMVKSDTTNAVMVKSDAPKAVAVKSDAPKAVAVKPDAPKAVAVKPDAPKADSVKTMDSSVSKVKASQSVAKQEKVVPAVPVDQIVTGKGVTCLICGKVFKGLKVHLLRSHKLDADAYRAQFGLPEDTPMSAK